MTEAFPKPPLPLVPLPANETERLAALHRYKILDTPPEVAFDRITSLAARLFKMPIALISLVDESRAWFKSCVGFGASEVPRDDTLCSFAVLTDEPLLSPMLDLTIVLPAILLSKVNQGCGSMPVHLCSVKTASI